MRRWNREDVLVILDVAKALLLLIMAIMFVNFNIKLAHQTAQIQASSNQRTRQIATLTNHIDCIVSLFRQPNRANLRITDIENCQLVANHTPVSSTPTKVSSSGGATTVAPKAQLPTTQPVISHSVSSQPAHSLPSAPSSGQKSSPTPTPKKPGLIKQIFNLLGL